MMSETEVDSSTTSGPGLRLLLDRYARDLPGVETSRSSRTRDTVASFMEGEEDRIHLRRTDGAFWEIMEFEFHRGIGPFTGPTTISAGNFVAVINEAHPRAVLRRAAAPWARSSAPTAVCSRWSASCATFP